MPIPDPVRIENPKAALTERTRQEADPVRNFKFQVQFFHPNSQLQKALGEVGFMSVEGIAMNTDMVPYREGGWNTNPHKLPGQTDFSPLTMSGGVFHNKPAMWNLAKQLFSAQWGRGNLGVNENFRFDVGVRVLDHPVTSGNESGAPGGKIAGAIMAFTFYNCWLDSMGNSILIHQMTVHHEGFETWWGNANAKALRNAAVG